MAYKMRTTEAIESPSKVSKNIEVFDLFYILGYIVVSIAFKSLVHSSLFYPYLIFSFLMGVFLTSKSFYNKKRRNYESIYFLLMRDRTIYMPVIAERNEGERIDE